MPPTAFGSVGGQGSAHESSPKSVHRVPPVTWTFSLLPRRYAARAIGRSRHRLFSTTLFVVPTVHAQSFDASGTLTLDGISWSPANLEMGGSSGSVSQDFTLSGGNSGSIYEGPPPDNIEFTIYDDPDAIYSAPSNWQHNSANGLWQNHNIYGPHTGYSATNNYGYEPGTYLRWNPGTTSGDLNVSLDYFNSDNDNGGFAFRFTDLDNMYWFDSDKQESDSRLYKKVNGASVSNVGNMTLGEGGDVSVASGSSLSAGG